MIMQPTHAQQAREQLKKKGVIRELERTSVQAGTHLGGEEGFRDLFITPAFSNILVNIAKIFACFVPVQLSQRAMIQNNA